SLKEAVDQSFNAISVDGDTSTNDCVLLLASGAIGRGESPAHLDGFQRALNEVCRQLAWMIVRDGEGATRVMELEVRGARNDREARLAAHAVATSPLVKTALFGGDPNWGRILAAVGRSGARFSIKRVSLNAGSVTLVLNGDPVIDRIVAIKTILVGGQIDEDENLADRLTMEARSAGRLHHPNIVTVFDFGKEGDLSYIVMEYVEGINLAKLIDDHRPLPLDTKLSLLVQIANGLAYAHERGVIHRDMKPSNVCVASPGTAKILDFGLARFDNTKLTKTGYMAGTIAYMSPERLSGITGAKDDIFALGAVAYELLTYERAFPGGTPPEVISKIIAPDPPRAPSQVAGVPEALDAVILKAL